MKMTKILLTGFLFICAAAFESCKKDNPATETVSINNGSNTFNPATINVSRSSTIIWTNNTSQMHTISNDYGKFESGDLPSGQQFSFTFYTPGTFPYHCKYHPMEKGNVVVQ